MTIEDQPPPKPSNKKPAWELVQRYVRDNYEDEHVDQILADMHERDRVGRERYGMPLTADNGRKQLVDAYQELLDAAVYLRAWLDEQGIDPDGMNQPTRADDLTAQQHVVLQHVVLMTFQSTIEALIDLRGMLP